MSKYMLIQSDEDGNPIRWLDDDDLKDITSLMENYGVKEWIEEFSESTYWGEDKAMLLKVEVANPIPTKVVQKWELPS